MAKRFCCFPRFEATNSCLWFPRHAAALLVKRSDLPVCHRHVLIALRVCCHPVTRSICVPLSHPFETKSLNVLFCTTPPLFLFPLCWRCCKRSCSTLRQETCGCSPSLQLTGHWVLSTAMASHGDAAELGTNEEFSDIIKWRSGKCFFFFFIWIFFTCTRQDERGYYAPF